MPSYPVLELEGTDPDLEVAVALAMDHGCLGTAELTGGAGVRAFFPEATELSPLLTRLSTSLPRLVARAAPPEPVRDWLEEWKASFTGFALGETSFVVPTWKPVPSISRSVLRIDPEQAFGTGTHDTTRLSASLLERHVCEGTEVVDVGSGTGILAMVAGRLGARSVLAIEPDPDAARCAVQNVARNELADRVRVVEARVEDTEWLAADVVVANIVRPVLDQVVPRLRAPVAILSGLLGDEVDEFTARHSGRIDRKEVWTAGDWSAVVLRMRR